MGGTWPGLLVEVRYLILAFLGLTVLLAGCSTCPRGAGRTFVPERDSFSFTNELSWSYEFGTNGTVMMRPTDPPPRYNLRCFPIVRGMREFFYHAKFAPELPRVSPEEYEELTAAVVSRNSRCPSEDADRIIIPGYADAFSFTADFHELVRDKCGGPLWSYLQRGNWRMIFPVSKRRFEKTAHALVEELRAGRMPIVHVYRFPEVRLNHGILLFSVEEKGGQYIFKAADPNSPGRVGELRYDLGTRTFLFERNQYFAGGAVRVYEVYRGLCY